LSNPLFFAQALLGCAYQTFITLASKICPTDVLNFEVVKHAKLSKNNGTKRAMDSQIQTGWLNSNPHKRFEMYL
jgi:hypothetical protein